MIVELFPLLQQRCVVLTLVRFDNDKVRVTVAPKKLNESENKALTTPFDLKGTPEELDAQIPSAFREFVGSHLELSSSLETAKELMAAAGKKAKAEARAKTAPKGATDKPADSDKPATTAAKPVDEKKQEKKEEKKPVVPKTASLFDMPMPTAAAAPAPAVPSDDAADDEEDDILSDIAEDGDDDSLDAIA